jgi:predicted GIY-YIG superfamily endonuclease
MLKTSCEKDKSMWVVYVLQSQIPRLSSKGKPLEGFFYVGSTTDVHRRLRQHNGEIKGGGKYTSKHRPWALMCVYGTFENRSEAMKAEMAVKKLRGKARLSWDSNRIISQAQELTQN